MYLGTSLFLMALGAILAFAVNATAEGFDINTAGWILIIVGAVGVLVSLLVLGRDRAPVERVAVEHERVPVERERVPADRPPV
ncbi:MAG TPA: DUF6458 family protein [Solirubrobacteraceae bacterium]|nr:DUF6458 family protein [Solirubrobacteraceae bacterium]